MSKTRTAFITLAVMFPLTVCQGFLARVTAREKYQYGGVTYIDKTGGKKSNPSDDAGAYDYANRRKKKAKKQKDRYNYNSHDLISPDSPWGRKGASAKDIAGQMQNTSAASWKQEQKKRAAAREGATSQPTTRPASGGEGEDYGGGINIANDPPGLGPTGTRERPPGHTTPRPPLAPPTDPKHVKYPPPEVSACEEGTIRFPDKKNIVKTCVWKIPGPPKIKITSATGHGKYAVEGVEDMLGDLSKIFGAIDDLMNLGIGQAITDAIGIPTSPMGYASSITGIGDKAVKAAARWSRKNARKLLNLSAEFNMQEVTVKCAEYEVCKNGKWVKGGIWPVEKPTVVNLPERHTYHSRNNPFFRKKTGREMRMMWNWYKRYAKELEKFEKDPCGCSTEEDKTAGGGGTKIGKPPKKARKSCEPIRTQIKTKKAELKEAKLDLKYLQKLLKLRTRERREAEKQWKKDRAAAEKALKNAIRKLKSAKAMFESFLQNAKNPSFSGKNFDSLYKKYSGRVEAAEKEVEAARKKLEGLKKYLSELDARLEAYKREIEEVKNNIKKLKGEISKLKADLKQCKKEGGI